MKKIVVQKEIYDQNQARMKKFTMAANKYIHSLHRNNMLVYDASFSRFNYSHDRYWLAVYHKTKPTSSRDFPYDTPLASKDAYEYSVLIVVDTDAGTWFEPNLTYAADDHKDRIILFAQFLQKEELLVVQTVVPGKKNSAIDMYYLDDSILVKSFEEPLFCNESTYRSAYLFYNVEVSCLLLSTEEKCFNPTLIYTSNTFYETNNIDDVESITLTSSKSLLQAYQIFPFTEKNELKLFVILALDSNNDAVILVYHQTRNSYPDVEFFCSQGSFEEFLNDVKIKDTGSYFEISVYTDTEVDERRFITGIIVPKVSEI